MMDAVFAIGFAAGLALAVPVGPMAILIIETTTSRGWRFGATGGFAMASVDFAYALVVFLVGTSVAGFLADWGKLLTLTGAAILIWLGATTLTRNFKRLRSASNEAVESSASAKKIHGESILSTFGVFAAATLFNPPTALYFLAIAPTIAHSAAGTPSAGLIFAFGVFVGSGIWQQTLAAGGMLPRKASGPRLQAVTGLVGGVLILVLAASIAVRGLA